MSSGSYYEEEMSSGGHRRLTAFILWPFSPSKKSPLDPPSPWSWLGAYSSNLFEKFFGTSRRPKNLIISHNLRQFDLFFSNRGYIKIKDFFSTVSLKKSESEWKFVIGEKNACGISWNFNPQS